MNMLASCVNLRTLATHLLVQNARHIGIKWVTLMPKRCSFVCIRILSMYRLEECDNYSTLSLRISQRQNCKFPPNPNVLFLHYNAHNNSSKSDCCQVGIDRRARTLAAAFVNNSASALQPYMKLMRIDKPIGTDLFKVLIYVPG